MRRLAGMVTLGAVFAALLVGCGAPAGTDGDLTDDWAALPEATQFAPEAGSCHILAEPSNYLSSYHTVDCAKPHRTETVYIGEFTGAHTERLDSPPAGSAALRSVFAECDAKVTEFVGANWRGGRLGIRVVPPSPPGWAAGARWYRCDVFEVNILNGKGSRGQPADEPVERAGSLRDALASPSPLAFTCFNEDEWDLTPVDCGKPHRYEYVGVWNAPEISTTPSTATLTGCSGPAVG